MNTLLIITLYSIYSNGHLGFERIYDEFILVYFVQLIYNCASTYTAIDMISLSYQL